MDRLSKVLVADVLPPDRVACCTLDVADGKPQSRSVERILVAAGSLCPGSVAKVLFDIIDAFTDHYFHIWVTPGQVGSSLDSARACLSDLGSHPPQNFEIMSSRGKIETLWPEVKSTFVNLFTDDNWFMSFSLERRIPIIMFSHSVSYFEDFPFVSDPSSAKVVWQRRAYLLADTIVCWSNIERGFISRFLPIVGEKIKVVPLCQRIPGPAFGCRSTPRKSDLKVLFAGRPLAKRKGFEYLVLALQQLAAKGYRVKLSVADAFTNAKRLARVRFLDLLEGIPVKWLRNLGREQMRRAYQRAHVVVVPSLYDSWCKVVTEAIAEETPVIATEATGVTEYFPRDEVLRVKAGDSRAIAAAIEEVVSDYARHVAATKRARKRLEVDFTLKKHAQRLRKAIGLP